MAWWQKENEVQKKMVPDLCVAAGEFKLAEIKRVFFRNTYLSEERGPKCENNVYDLCRARMFSILSGGLVEALFHGLWGESMERRSPKNDSPRGLVWTEKRRTEFSIS